MNKKNKHIQIRVSEKEREIIERLANKRNLNLSEFLKLGVVKIIMENETNEINKGMNK